MKLETIPQRLDRLAKRLSEGKPLPSDALLVNAAAARIRKAEYMVAKALDKLEQVRA